MVIGSAGELPKAPTGPVTFLEDMTESQIAQAVSVVFSTSELNAIAEKEWCTDESKSRAYESWEHLLPQLDAPSTPLHS